MNWIGSKIGVIASSPSRESITKREPLTPFGANGDGWFELYVGSRANEVVRKLRKARREKKELKDEIDNLIKSILVIKEHEIQSSLDMFPWLDGHHATARKLGLTESTLKSLRKQGTNRKETLYRAILKFEKAHRDLNRLGGLDTSWSDVDKQVWLESIENRRDARSIWKKALSPEDSLTKQETQLLNKSGDILRENGALPIRDINERLYASDTDTRGVTTKSLSMLFKMHGDDFDIVKGSGRSTWTYFGPFGLVIKDVWAYTAGFLDADGYLAITGRGEPRAGIVATGDRGKLHCEEMYKSIEIGKLQLDQKIYKNGQRSQHRLQFYSKDDLKKLLTGVMPHLRMKKAQAKAMLEYLEAGDDVRKQELQRLIQYKNWEDTAKGETLLAEWGITAEKVAKLEEGLHG